MENCGSVYLVEGERILLVWHEKHGKWLPAGGHCEVGEDPWACALRELMEETGYEAEILGDDRVVIDRWNARSVPRPFVILVEKIPAGKDGPAHEHLDFVFFGKPTARHGHGSEKTRWFSRDEIVSMESDVDIFHDTKLIVDKIFNKLAQTINLP